MKSVIYFFLQPALISLHVPLDSALRKNYTVMAGMTVEIEVMKNNAVSLFPPFTLHQENPLLPQVKEEWSVVCWFGLCACDQKFAGSNPVVG